MISYQHEEGESDSSKESCRFFKLVCPEVSEHGTDLCVGSLQGVPVKQLSHVYSLMASQQNVRCFRGLYSYP